MKLHYGALSSSSRRVRITASLLGNNLEEVTVDLRDAKSCATEPPQLAQLEAQVAGQPSPEGRHPRPEA